jgi:hypothetical protein
MPKFDDYKSRYQHVRMEPRDGILQIIFHTEGGPPDDDRQVGPHL